MEMALGMSQSDADQLGYRGTNEGGKLKSTTLWDKNGNGTNSSGFNACPGGFYDGKKSFYFLGVDGNWWSSTEESHTYTRSRYLNCGNEQIAINVSSNAKGYSVRCLKN